MGNTQMAINNNTAIRAEQDCTAGQSNRGVAFKIPDSVNSKLLMNFSFNFCRKKLTVSWLKICLEILHFVNLGSLLMHPEVKNSFWLFIIRAWSIFHARLWNNRSVPILVKWKVLSKSAPDLALKEQLTERMKIYRCVFTIAARWSLETAPFSIKPPYFCIFFIPQLLLISNTSHN